MDYVRYILAMGVVVDHFNTVMNAECFWPVQSGISVGIFFGISGFLVNSSYLRSDNLWNFVLGRAKRIIPIYSMVVLCSVLLLSFFSSLSLLSFYTHIDTWKYIVANMCFLNFIQPTLPGVFTDNTISAVNGSLWTLKVEWFLYLSIPLFHWILRKTKIHMSFLLALTFLLSLGYKYVFLYLYDITGKEIYYTLSYQFIGQMIYFYSGVLFYHYSDFLIKNSHWTIFITVLTYVLSMFIVNCDIPYISNIVVSAVLPVSMVLFFISISCISKSPYHLPRIPNLSYELYLIHFPVIQLVAQELKTTSLSMPILFIVELIVILFVCKLMNIIITKTVKQHAEPNISNRLYV